MALVGLKKVTIFLVDPTTHKLVTGENGLSTNGILDIGSESLGSTQANITGLEGNIEKVSGNNVVQDVYVDPASPAVAWTVNNLDIAIRNKILGYIKSGAGWKKSAVKPHLGLIVNSEDWNRTKDIFYAFPEGVLQMTGQNVATDTDSKTTREPDAMNFTALHSHTINDDHAIYLSSDEGFTVDAMLKEVADGYTSASNTGH